MRVSSLVVVLSLLSFGAEGALAQRALGDGNALDNNLQQGSSGRNARARNLEREFRLRNAIVTGHAAGGASFRGDLGYTAADDFRGETAEDDLFAFDRDSFYSGLTGQGVRGADALRMQMQLTVGGFVGEGDFLLDPVVRRDADATSVARLENQQRLQNEFGSQDPLLFRDGSLRATSAYLARSAETPVLLKVDPRAGEGETPVYTLATPLRSLMTQSTVQPERRLSDVYASLLRVESRLENPAVDDRAASSKVDTQADVYREILDRHLARQAAAEEEEAERGGEKEEGDGVVERGPAVEAVEEPELLARLRELREDLMRPETATPEYGGSDDEADPDATEELRRRIAADAQKLFEGKAIRVETIAPVSRDETDVFATHMTRGQELLGSGQWFAAEERFTSALGLRPGDPMAAVGRVHAQIGGGMFLSAGLNLQKLFRAHPELINVKYDGALLPLGERLDEIEALLLTRLRGTDDFSRGAALVRAYLGFQSSRADWVSGGLERATEIDAALDRPADPLLDVLGQAWDGR